MHLLSVSLTFDVPRRILSLPRVLLLGLVVLTLAASVDLVYHTLPPDLELSFQPLLGEQAIRAHLAMFGGMLLMVVGLMRMGVAR